MEQLIFRGPFCWYLAKLYHLFHIFIWFPCIDTFFMVTQETIIYRLEVRNHDLMIFEKIIFLAGKRAWLPWWCRKVWASTPDKKVSPVSGTFGSTVISKTCFQICRAWTPPPLRGGKVNSHFIFASDRIDCQLLPGIIFWNEKKVLAKVIAIKISKIHTF